MDLGPRCTHIKFSGLNFKVVVQKGDGGRADLCDECYDYVIQVADNIQATNDPLPDPTDDEHG